MKSFSNVIEPDFDQAFHNKSPLKGKWYTDVFKNDHPIVLELGCGKGEYTTGLAQTYPEKNFIGIDIKGARMWVGAGFADKLHLTNAVFLRTRIEFINSFFAENEVSEIWVTFPDPQPKKKRNRKRLTSSNFLNNYSRFLMPGGRIHLKTDSRFLHEYTREIVSLNQLPVHCSTRDLYGEKPTGTDDLLYSIQTHYESLFRAQGVPITYLSFSLKPNVMLIEPDDDQQEYLLKTFLPVEKD
ncbi:MAG: tRNA (guanosine(46)-N7)-methyltransferase TrmB [Bacteroidetes bacterium HGW-Bacteroidetes-21]|jgi:tRNA (guanine-N7-)-methyltransferase|nr:MAG: tRNA (guanosine(46)-N7)-methyltransferase TrmB [Bacteroidetes bacterium HGW-Bacteroidetes-21]